MALSDGVFAIAITLLVLEIRFPEIPESEIDALFLSGLGTIIPNLIGFALSFFIIASYWFSYHRILHFVGEADRTLAMLNIVFLFFIAFIPFPTALIGLYGAHMSIVIFYAVSILLSSIVLFLMWWHAAAGYNLIDKSLDRRFVEYLTVRLLVPVASFSASIFVALINPLLAMILWSSLAFAYPIVKWAYTRNL